MTTRFDWTVFLALGAALMIAAPAAAQQKGGLQQGTPEIQSAGPIAFAPEGVLLLGDPQGAAVFAIETGDVGQADKEPINIEGIQQKVAAALGTQPQDVLINDLAVNPASGNVYLSVSRGAGPQAQPVVLRVDRSGKIEDVSLENVRYAKASLPNPPADQEVERRGRRENQRRESITDLAYVDGRVIIAGLSNEEFASKLRSIEFPFQQADEGTSVEIYHGAHGQFETRSPVRTFVAYEIEGTPHLLAAYQCTPLVKFPLSDLQPGKKVQGTTVAELGNRNRPLDMIVYDRGDQSYILMANSSRGVMKIPTAGIEDIAAIEERIEGTAGLSYETVTGLEGVEQLDQLSDQQAVVLVRHDDGQADLKTIDLP